MPLLTQVYETQAFSVHLLLCGRSKTGKTKYIADMIKLGFKVFYVDNDNGAATLTRDTKDKPEAMNNCYYVRTENLWEFTQTFFARLVFQWNLTQDCLYQKTSAQPDDIIMTIKRKHIPPGVVFIFDSWTSLCIQLINKASTKAGVSAEDARIDQDVYGSMNRSANTVGMNIQSFPHHVIYLAHTDYYERRESPPGIAKEMAKQQIIKENVEIPWSVSRPHGYAMPKFFTDIGYLGISNTGNFTLDFRQAKDRVGAGSPRKIGDPTTDLRFDNAFFEGKVPVVDVPFDSWVWEEPASEVNARIEAEAAEKAAKAEALKAATGKTPAVAANPAQPLPGTSLLKK